MRGWTKNKAKWYCQIRVRVWPLKISDKLIFARFCWLPRPMFLKTFGQRQKSSLQILHGVTQLSCPLPSANAQLMSLGLAKVNEAGPADTDYQWLSSPAASHLWWVPWQDRGSASSLVRLSVHREVNRHAEWVLVTGNAKSPSTDPEAAWTSVSDVLLSVTSTHGNGINRDVYLVVLSPPTRAWYEL